MSINKFNSCERNNYFFGKLMTVKDFENEQTYFNSKRQLCSNMLHGFGIVSGLKVFLINNQTLSVDAGLAIDQNGREVMLPEACVKKISVIDGFEEYCDEKELYLCIRYKEDLEETTFSVAGSGKGSDIKQEYNRIQEGCQLFFTNQVPDEKSIGLSYLMFEEKVIYDNDGVTLKAVFPKYINPSKLFKMTLIFEKKNVSAPVNFDFELSGEFFKSKEKEDSVKISYRETEISTYKTFKKDYFVYCDAVSDTLTDIEVKKKSFKLEIGNKINKIESDIKHSIVVTEQSLKDVLINQYYSLDLDSAISYKDEACIYLAKINLVSNQSDYFIEAFENNPFDQYLFSTQMLSLFDVLDGESMDLPIDLAELEQEVSDDVSVVSPLVSGIDCVTGIEEITFGFYPKVGKSYFSNEFVHGLGYGQISIVLAVDNPENLATGEEHIFYFGNRAVFDDEDLPITSAKVDVAATVNPEKGTMKIGVQLLEKTEQTSVRVRWWAFKPTNNQLEEDVEILLEDNVKVVASPATAQVEPLGQFRFTAKIEGSSSQEVKWYLPEEGTGSIDNNGLYTAPSKEGVYEVRAQSVKFENKFASVYIVVSAY
ncbi:MAG: hypothetical protein Q4B14_06705 [Clostridia bacterium]|nr:hypothetical protein [Clostridia bacterium]